MSFLTINAETETVRDLDLAQALGYRTDRMIRTLIKKHQPVLEQFGPLALQAVTQVRKNGASHETTEFHLNRKQAIYLTTQAFAFLDSLESIAAPWATDPPASTLRVSSTP